MRNPKLNLLSILLAVAAVAASQSDPRQLTKEVRAWNEQWKNTAGALPEEALQKRAALLEALIESDAESALQTALPATETTHGSSLIESHGSWEGRVTVAVEHTLDEQPGRTRLWLETGGEYLQLYPAGEPGLRTGETVSARGIRLGDKLAAEVSRVNTLEPAAACTSLGELRYAVLLYEFPSYKLSPSVLTAAELREAFFSRTDLSLGATWVKPPTENSPSAETCWGRSA